MHLRNGAVVRFRDGSGNVAKDPTRVVEATGKVVDAVLINPATGDAWVYLWVEQREGRGGSIVAVALSNLIELVEEGPSAAVS